MSPTVVERHEHAYDVARKSLVAREKCPNVAIVKGEIVTAITRGQSELASSRGRAPTMLRALRVTRNGTYVSLLDLRHWLILAWLQYVSASKPAKVDQVSRPLLSVPVSPPRVQLPT